MSSESEVPSAKSSVLIFMRERKHTPHTHTLLNWLALGHTLRLRASHHCTAERRVDTTLCDIGTFFGWSVVSSRLYRGLQPTEQSLIIERAG